MMKSPYLVLAFVLMAGCLPETATRNERVNDKAKAPSSSSSPNTSECAIEAKYQCQYECIETATPPNRNKCEVECNKRPLSFWNNKIPACTA